MGSVVSNAPTREPDEGNGSDSETMSDSSVFHDAEEKVGEDTNTPDDGEARNRAKEEEMNEFKRQLNIKREQRKEILARHRNEKEELNKSLQSERAAKLKLIESNKLLCELLTKHNIEIPDNLLTGNSDFSNTLVQIREEFEVLKSNNLRLRRDLSETNKALQDAYSDIADLNGQNTESMKQIQALKEVVSVSKTMISLREQQLNDLKNKLNEIERTLADRETNILSADLRQEYERQLQNIRTLRGLYEERARLAEVTRQGIIRELDEHKILYQAEVKKSKNLAEKVEELETKIDALLETIDNKNSLISSCQKEKNELKAEMTVVNKLFSQVLLGYKTKQDLDTLVQRLEENHGLLTQMAENEDDSEASTALPKLLLEIVSQVDENEDKCNSGKEPENQEEEAVKINDSESQKPPTSTAEEIVENLPKVWKVLIELLSHQNAPEVNSEEKVTTCYKSVETKSGPVLVPSVSQTYIRLKDLIIEKLGLIKEVNRMKQLNNHLETRLSEQERRLCLVTNELSKTWHVVGRLRRHHHQLHTHEKILKYELQQKRKLLNELKEELEYCREKWEQAREKNTQSEEDWRKLRAEFSNRKTSPSLNNSAESGYSDERPSDESSESNDESEYVAEPLIRCKKKQKKSFETVFDSSTDFNLVAEREDPASDMLDVADLPLDTQESEEHHEIVSQASQNENISNLKIFEETEDEVCDITHDESCPEEGSISITDASVSQTDTSREITSSQNITQPDNSVLIDPAEILRNIQLQNQRLASKDEKLKNLESSSSALLKKTQMTAKISQEINNTLDHIINRPSSSHQIDINKNLEEANLIGQTTNNNTRIGTDNNDVGNTSINIEISTNIPDEEIKELSHQSISKPVIKPDNPSIDCPATSQANARPMPDYKAILESVKMQNERLAKKDERLQNLESGCSEVLNTLTNTLDSSGQIMEKLETLHLNANTGHESRLPPLDNTSNSDKEEAMPSTSNEVDHNARFAARDLRLKRLEEQTKSLVNKVNNTTTKGVKIHYKLEELHNIYGSESSRAGTPSEENEDKNNDNESQDDND